MMKKNFGFGIMISVLLHAGFLLGLYHYAESGHVLRDAINVIGGQQSMAVVFTENRQPHSSRAPTPARATEKKPVPKIPSTDGEGQKKKIPTESGGGPSSFGAQKSQGINRPPEYPPLARRWNWEGVVLLEIQVTINGRAATVIILESSGYPVLDQAAQKAALNWQYPEKGKTYRMKKEIEFRIKNR